jgi:hypothetical protein
MLAPTRSAPAAFGRGVSQVVANPGLLLAPLAFGGAVVALVAAAVLAAVFSFGRAFASRVVAFGRGPAVFSDLVEGLRGFLLASPVAVLIALAGVLVALLVLTALAAWIRAGVTGSLAEIDARTAEDAPLAAFRHPSVGAAFFASASRLFGGFLALVNLYALVASFIFLLVAAPLVFAFVAMASGRSGLTALFAVLFAVVVLFSVVLSIAMRVVYLVAGRVVAVEGLDALAATARAIALVKGSLGRSLTLYFLTVGGAMAVGLAFVFPRVVLTLAAGWSHAGVGAMFAVTAFFIALQVGAGLAYDLAVTGSFVALWPAGSAQTAPAEVSSATVPSVPPAPEPPAP